MKTPPVCILVHPGSLCGSFLTVNDWHPHWKSYAQACRELLLAEFEFFAGTRAIIRGGLVDDEADHNERLQGALARADERYHARPEGKALNKTAAAILQRHPDASRFLITGAWADPGEGCAFAIYDFLQRHHPDVKLSRYAARSTIPRDIEYGIHPKQSKPKPGQWHVADDADALQKNREHLAYWTAKDPRWGTLNARLMQIGGVVVCATLEEDMTLLIEQGRTWTPRQKDIRMKRGETSRCHSNALLLQEANPRLRVATGWALSNDGIWRQHSWCVDTDWSIVETTKKRVAYHGAFLPAPLCKERLQEIF